MNNLPIWCLTSKHPAVNDTESATVLEQTAKIYGAMQTLIDEHNGFINDINAKIDAFINNSQRNYDEFKKCITATVENYIQMLDDKIYNIEKAVKNATVECVYDETNESLDFVVINEE